MNCLNHPDIPATAFCRTCGKPVCEACRRDAQGTVYCDDHLPAMAAPPPASTPPPGYSAAPPPPYGAASPVPGTPSPGWALMLGLLIPGVGAIYNGQYAKGLVHAVVFGLLVSILSHGGSAEALLGLLLTAWIFYMGFEAYHTALKRRRGEPVDECSRLIPGGAGQTNFPVAGVALIALGGILLLDTLDLVSFRHLVRYWPVLLIVAGAYLLYARATEPEDSRREARHER